MRKLLIVCAAAFAAGAAAEDKLGFTKKVLITRGELCALTLAATWQNEGWEAGGSRFSFKYDSELESVFVTVTQKHLEIGPREVGELAQRGIYGEDMIRPLREKIPQQQRSVAEITLNTTRDLFLQVQMRTNNVCAKAPVFIFRLDTGEFARLEKGVVTFSYPDHAIAE